MSIYLSIILILYVIFLFISKKEKALMFFYVFALTNNALQFDLGIAFKLYHLIVILYLPRLLHFFARDLILRKNVKPIVYDYILMLFLGLIFGFLFKFDDPFESFRMFTQRAEMRAIISSFRIFIELFSIVLIYYWFRKKVLSTDLLVKVVSLVVITNVAIAILFFISDNQIFRFLFPTDRIANLSGRFNGLNGEPRAFGRNNAFLMIFLLYFKSTRYQRIRKNAIFSSIIGVLLSMSASAYITAMIGLSIYTLLKRNVYQVVFVILVSSLFIFFMSDNYVFQSSTSLKIRMILTNNEQYDNVEQVQVNEPKIFTRFEIFDRAALNFFYDNPGYMFFGVGPNLITIPASEYVTYSVKNTEIYGQGINTAPATFIVSTISKTGLLGLSLWMWFFISVLRKLKRKEFKFFWINMIIMNFLTTSNLFFLFTGLLLSLIRSSQINGILSRHTMKFNQFFKIHKKFI